MPRIAAAALFGAACADAGTVGVAPEDPSSVHVVSADRRRPVDVSEIPPGAKADTAVVARRHIPLLVGARLTADGRIVRNGAVLGQLLSRIRSSTDSGPPGAVRAAPDAIAHAHEHPDPGGPPMAVGADGITCWVLFIYYVDNGEIINVILMGCSGGSGSVDCSADQEAIAQEYLDWNVDGEWDCSLFDDPVTSGTGTDSHDQGYLTGAVKSGQSTVKAYMFSEHGVSVGVTSDWRCPVGNAAVGGSNTSNHMHGTASDFVFTGYDGSADHKKWFEEARVAAGGKNPIPYDTHYHMEW